MAENSQQWYKKKSLSFRISVDLIHINIDPYNDIVSLPKVNFQKFPNSKSQIALANHKLVLYCPLL